MARALTPLAFLVLAAGYAAAILADVAGDARMAVLAMALVREAGDAGIVIAERHVDQSAKHAAKRELRLPLIALIGRANYDAHHFQFGHDGTACGVAVVIALSSVPARRAEASDQDAGAPTPRLMQAVYHYAQ